MSAISLRFATLLIWILSFTSSDVLAQSLPKCSVTGVVPDGEGNMSFSIQGDKDFYVGNALFVLYIGKSAFTLNTQDGASLIFYIPLSDFNKLAEGEQMFLKYGDSHSSEDEELLSDACRQKAVNVSSLGLFTRDLLRR